MFQSTRPRGARQDRTLGGSLAECVSIHAPAWGATAVASQDRLAIEFQSTRPRGARPRRCAADIVGDGSFNPRARVGRDSVFLFTSPRA